MTKDRLADLVNVQSERGLDEVSVKITDGPYNDSMQGFLAEVEELRQMIESIRTNVEEVKLKHSDILSAPYTDEKLQMKLEDLMDSIMRTANIVRAKLNLMRHGFENDDKKSSTADLRIRKTQQSTLAQMLVEAMMEYNRTQSEHRDRCKARLQRQLEITGKTTTNAELEEMLEQGDPAVFTQGIIVETQQARQTCADIEARHIDILKLEASIRELHDMFVDMAVLVEGQGQLVDSIEYHVTKTESFVGDGTSALHAGQGAQAKARRKRMYVAVCLLVVAVIIIAIVVC